MKKLLASGIIVILIGVAFWIIGNLAFLSCGRTCPTINQTGALPALIVIGGLVILIVAVMRK